MEGDEESAVQKQYLTACLHALRHAKTDTEKFAALLLVTKVVQAQYCSTGDKRQILEAVGFPFLLRLFRTNVVPEGCSVLIYKSVAVSVLSAVIDDPAVASGHQMSVVIPCLKEILEMVLMEHLSEEDRKLQLEMVGDAHTILSRVACTSQGAHLLLDHHFPGLLVQILDSRPDEATFVMMQTLLLLLLHQCGTKVWTGPSNCFDRYLQVLASCVSDCEDKTLFRLCELTTQMLNYAPEARSSEASVTFLHPLLHKLSLLIRCKLGVRERKVVLSLMNQLAVTMGLQCLLPPIFPDHKMFMLVLNLTCAEVRLTVENVTEDQVKQSASDLSLLYSMLETALQFLCRQDSDLDDDDGDDDNMSLPLQPDMFCQAHDALLGAAHGVFYFLQQVDSGALVLPVQDPVIGASVRLIAAITSQAFSEVKDDVLNVLPLLVRLCETEAGKAEDEGGMPSARKTITHNADVTNAADSIPSEDRQKPCTCVADKLTQLHIGSDSGAQSSDCLSSVEASEAECSVSKHQCQTGCCEVAIDWRSCLDENKETGVSAKSRSAVGADNTVEETKHDGTEQGLPSVLCDQGSQYRQRAWKNESSGAHMVDGGSSLPRTLEELATWVCDRARGSSQQLLGLQIIKFVVAVFEVACEDADSRRAFLELRGPTVLVDVLTHRLPIASTTHCRLSAHDLDAYCQALRLLLQLTMQDEDLCQSPPFTHLLHTAVITLPLLDDVLELYVYRAHWTATGLSLLRVRGSPQKACSEEQISKFLQSSIPYVCQAPCCGTGTGAAADRGTEAAADRGTGAATDRGTGAAADTGTGAELWQDVEDMWAVALDSLTSLVPSFPELIDLLLTHGFLDMAASLLGTGKGSSMKKETAAALRDLVSALAQGHQGARQLLDIIAGPQLTT